MVKQEMARVNINILGISELNCMGMGKFNSDDYYVCYYGQESLRRNRIALIVNKMFPNAVFGYTFKNDKMILVHFQGKSFKITVIESMSQPPDTKEEVDQLYEDLEDLLELTPKKMSFSVEGMECKNRKSRDTWSNRQVWPWRTE